jgi:hypothetical protein
MMLSCRVLPHQLNFTCPTKGSMVIKGYLNHSGNACQRHLFKQEFVNQGFGFIGNELILRIQNKLPVAAMATAILLALMNHAIFDNGLEPQLGQLISGLDII